MFSEMEWPSRCETCYLSVVDPLIVRANDYLKKWLSLLALPILVRSFRTLFEALSERFQPS